MSWRIEGRSVTSCTLRTLKVAQEQACQSHKKKNSSSLAPCSPYVNEDRHQLLLRGGHEKLEQHGALEELLLGVC
jgi:hypothetical protein